MYCLKSKKHTENISPQVSSTSNGKVMILLKRTIYGHKKLRFTNKQQA